VESVKRVGVDYVVRDAIGYSVVIYGIQYLPGGVVLVGVGSEIVVNPYISFIVLRISRVDVP
jgi:hypothetical protein